MSIKKDEKAKEQTQNKHKNTITWCKKKLEAKKFPMYK